MDVRLKRNIFAILSFMLVIGCSNGKDPESKIIDDSNNRFGGSCIGQAIPSQYIVKYKSGIIKTVKADSKEELIEKVIQPENEFIDFVEQDRKVYAQKNVTLQFESTLNANPETGWGQTMVEAGYAWSQGVTGDGVTVAVVDSGVEITHPQLQNQIAFNEGEIPNNNIDDDRNGLVDDYYGYDFFYKTANVTAVGSHATHVAGIVLGQHETGPIQGIAPGAKLIPLNFMDPSGAGDLSDAISAINYATARGAKVINASWGGAPCSETLYQALASLREKGVLIVVAAGNDGENIDYNPTYPAAYNVSNQITIGATASTDRMAGFSNFGNHLVHVMAPGMGIWSSVPGGGFANMSGTSMAAPFVSGAAALLMSYKPTATIEEIKSAIMKSVDGGQYPVLTKGRINIRKALSSL